MQDLVLRIVESPAVPDGAWTTEVWHGFPGSPGYALRYQGTAAFSRAQLEAPTAAGVALDRATVLERVRTLDDEDQLFVDVGLRLFDMLQVAGATTELDAWRAQALALPASAPRPCLYLDVPATLAEWPWELLAWRSGGITDLAFMMDRTPIVRLGAAPIAQLPADDMTVRILLVPGEEELDRDDATARASSELRLIRKAFHNAGLSVLVEQCEPPENLAQLEARITEAAPHVLHFIGHGDIDEAAPHQEFALQFKRTVPWEWSLTQIRQFFLNNWRPRLVVLNACHSSQRGRQATPVVDALLGAGIPAVIGAQAALQIDYSRLFAECLYGALAKELPLHRAMVSARHLLSTAARYAGHRRRHWALPVLTVRAPVEQVLRFKRANNTITQCEISREVYSRPGRFVNRTADRRSLLASFRPLHEGATAFRGVILQGDATKVGKDWLMKRSVRDFLDNDFLVRHATLVGPRARTSLDVLEEWRGLPTYASSPMCAPLPAAPFADFDEAVRAARGAPTARHMEEVFRAFKAGMQQVRQQRNVLLILGRFRSQGQNWVPSEDFREHLLEKLLLPIAAIDPVDADVAGLHALLVVRKHQGLETGQPSDFDEFALQRLSAEVPEESRRPADGFRRVKVSQFRKAELDRHFDEFVDFRDGPAVVGLRSFVLHLVKQDPWAPQELHELQPLVVRLADSDQE